MIKKYSIIILLISQAFITFILGGCAGNEASFEIEDGSEFLMQQDEAHSESQSVTVTDGEALADDGIREEIVADQATIIVYVCGQVKNPGVYELPLNSRVYEAINAAGGLLADAASNVINQAEVIYDGQKLYVPTKKEVSDGTNGADISIISGGEQSSVTTKGSSINVDEVKVNINIASAQELTAIPGIGNTKASAIVSYRESGKRFDKPEDITNVSGIGQSTYEKIKDYITVN